jgi:hypothetical protein
VLVEVYDHERAYISYGAFILPGCMAFVRVLRIAKVLYLSIAHL